MNKQTEILSEQEMQQIVGGIYGIGSMERNLTPGPVLGNGGGQSVNIGEGAKNAVGNLIRWVIGGLGNH